MKSKGFHQIKQEQRRNIATSENDPPAIVTDIDDDVFVESVQNIEDLENMDDEHLEDQD